MKNGAQQTMKQPTIMLTVLAAFFSLLRLRSCEMMCSLAKRDAINDVRFSAADVTDDVEVLVDDGVLAVSR